MSRNLVEHGVCSWQIKTIDLVREQCEEIFRFVSEEVIEEELNYTEMFEIILGSVPTSIITEGFLTFHLRFIKPLIDEASKNIDSSPEKRFLDSIIRMPFILSYSNKIHESNDIPIDVEDVSEPITQVHWDKMKELVKFIINLVKDKQEIARIEFNPKPWPGSYFPLMSFGKDVEVDSIDFSFKDNPYIQRLAVEFDPQGSMFSKTIFTRPMKMICEGIFTHEWFDEKLNLIRASSPFIRSLEV